MLGALSARDRPPAGPLKLAPIRPVAAPLRQVSRRLYSARQLLVKTNVPLVRPRIAAGKARRSKRSVTLPRVPLEPCDRECDARPSLETGPSLREATAFRHRSTWSRTAAPDAGRLIRASEGLRSDRPRPCASFDWLQLGGHQTLGRRSEGLTVALNTFSDKSPVGRGVARRVARRYWKRARSETECAYADEYLQPSIVVVGLLEQCS
jgi:hypothetical protein